MAAIQATAKKADTQPKYLRDDRDQAITRIGGRTYVLGRFGSLASRIQYEQIVSAWEAVKPACHTR